MLEFRNRRQFENYKRKHQIRESTAVSIDGIVIKHPMNLKSFTTIYGMKSNPHYERAKGGDFKEAMLLVEELLNGKSIPKYENVCFAPVIAQEKSGRNKIPLALATFLAKKSNSSVTVDIIQAIRANHTGAGAADRMEVVEFDKMEEMAICGNEFVIVDDVVTMGGTVFSLAKFITDHGGIVRDIVALAYRNIRKQPRVNGKYPLQGTIESMEKCRERFGEWPLRKFGWKSYDEIPEDMLAYLLKFKSLENLQKKFNITLAFDKSLNEAELESIWKEFSADILENLYF